MYSGLFNRLSQAVVRDFAQTGSQPLSLADDWRAAEEQTIKLAGARGSFGTCLVELFS
jgi:hypothetical protein